jgi:hypothetical protein
MILLLTSRACKRGISIEALTSLNSGRWLGSSCQQSCSNLVSLSGTCEGISGRRPLIEEWYPLIRNIYSDKYKKISLNRNFQTLHASSPSQSKLQLQTFVKLQASSTYAYTPRQVGARFIKAKCFLEWLWWHSTDSYPNMLHKDLWEDMVHIILPQNMFG